MAVSRLDIEKDPIFLLYDVARLIRLRADQRARQHEMTRAQWVILAWLELRPAITQNELAGLVDVEPITVGRLVDRLEARGVVERHRDPADRRVWRLHLTDAAEPVLKEIRAYRADVNNAVVRLLGKDAVAELGKSLQTIKAELQDDESEIARPGATKVRSAS
ncbi:MAG: MarR family transcriptional regulator [Hyphomicrobiales bacterium]|nr:MarR family transcriptional regulator [Hyphomicrobiales bacterium]